MTRNSAAEQHSSQEEERHHPASGPARMVPRVTFGLGVAVLTGLAVVTVAPTSLASSTEHIVTTHALGAAINHAGPAPMETTCCGPG